MPNTLPEGFTPVPIMVDSSRSLVGSKVFLTIASSILGIVVGMGVVLGTLGKAFYVDRVEFTAKNTQDEKDKVTFTAGLREITSRFDRQESSLYRMESSIGKLADDLQAFKYDTARRHGK